MLLRLFAFILCPFFFSAHTLALGSKTIKVRPLPNSAGAMVKTSDVIPVIADFAKVSNDVSGVAYYDQKNIYLALTTDKKILTRSFREIGLRFRIKGNKKKDFILRLQPTNANVNFQRPLRIASGIEPLLPNNVNGRLKAFMPSGEYAAYLVASQGRMGTQLFVPDFDALYQDSTAMFVLRIPLVNPLYPGSALPFDKRGKLKIDFEIGEEFFMRASVNTPRNMYPGSNRQQQQPLNGFDDQSPRFGFDKFSLELIIENWPELSNTLKVSHEQFSLNTYLELLHEWSATAFANRGRANRGRGGRGAAPGLPPISVYALFASSKVVQSGIGYVATFLRLSDQEQEQIFNDFNVQWETDSYFPVLVTLRTGLHESYLDLSRWTIFLEDEKRNQYEAMKVVDVTNSDPRNTPKGATDENQIRRPVFSSLVKKIAMLFPKRDHDGKPIWEKSNRKLKLVVLSNEHFEQRLELEWRIPN